VTEVLLHMLAMSAYNGYNAALCGSPTPSQRSLIDFMSTEPEMGDLVMEASTVWYRERDSVRIGRLIGCVEEYVPNDDGEQPAEDEVSDYQAHYAEPYPKERFWYIATPTGCMFRWNNARFLRLPEDILR